MKKNLIFGSIALCALLAVPFAANAQTTGDGPSSEQKISLTVNGSALLKVVNTKGASTDIAMSMTGATVAGAALSPDATNEDTRLRITSSVEDAAKSRTITAALATSISATNTELYVTLTKPTDFLPKNGTADYGGTTADEQLLTVSGTSVVTGIKTCWSGTGDDQGYKVKYRYAKVANAAYYLSGSAKVIYTIQEPA